MTIWFYVKTDDTPKEVGDLVCANNVFEDAHPKGRYSWVMEHAKGPEDYWLIRGKYEELKDMTNVAMLYRSGDTVAIGEVNSDFVSNFMDPLLEKYGFDNVKAIVTTIMR